MSLKDISKATNLNKATLHEHLTKLNEAGLVKKRGREGHKWVYYKLSWKGECLLHPENTRIVVLFSATFFTLFFGIIQLIHFAKGKIVGLATTVADKTEIYAAKETSILPGFAQEYTFAPVSNISAYNQTITIDGLSKALNENATIRGVIGNSFADSDIQWTVSLNGVNEALDFGGRFVHDSWNAAEAPANVPTMVAFVQDPALMYLAIGCLILFMALILISIWRLWENKTPKL
jgi:DNA-binding transcriptional ArsR family regulator